MKRWTMAGLLGLGLAGPAWAQSDLTQFNVPCAYPNQTTNCARIHGNSSSVSSMTLTGEVLAAGGYKVAYVFAHPNYSVSNISNVQAPIAGTGPAAINATGPLYIIPGYAGSIIAVSIVSDTAITAHAAHAEAVRWDGSSARATGLTAVIGSGLANTTTATTTQARGQDIFTASEGVGCRISRAASSTPASAMIACIVTVSQ